MGKRRAPLPKKFKGVDPLALAEVQAHSVDARTRRGLPLTKEQEKFWSPEVAEALDRIHLMRFYNIRGKLLNDAQTDPRLTLKALALKAGETLDDRRRGRPTEHQVTSGRVTVVFSAGEHGGVNPNLLPDAGSAPIREKAARVVELQPASKKPPAITQPSQETLEPGE